MGDKNSSTRAMVSSTGSAYARPSGPEVKPSQAPRVFDMLSSAEGAIGELEQRVSVLLERIEPVLGNTPPVPMDAGAVTGGGQSQIASRLMGLTERIALLTGHVQQALQRIEI